MAPFVYHPLLPALPFAVMVKCCSDTHAVRKAPLNGRAGLLAVACASGFEGGSRGQALKASRWVVVPSNGTWRISLTAGAAATCGSRG